MQPSMRTKLFTRVTGTALGALASGALLGALGTSCQQPKSLCSTAHQHYAAKFELKSGDPMTCGRFKGDVLGMNTYFATGGLNGTPKFNEPSMAIRAQYAGLQFIAAQEHAAAFIEAGGDPVPEFEDDPKDPNDYDHMPNALGDFVRGEPDAQDLCHADKVGPAVIDLPAFPEIPASDTTGGDTDTTTGGDTDTTTGGDTDTTTGTTGDATTGGTGTTTGDATTGDTTTGGGSPGLPAFPAKKITYEWSNAKWLVSPNYQGTQFEADLKFTEDGCTAEYHVIAVAPAIPCMSDDDCTTEGVGINPDFAVKCDLGFEDLETQPDVPATPAVPDDPATPDVDESVPAMPAQDWGLCVLSAKEIPSLNQ